MSIRSRRGEFGLGAKGFAVKFYKIARLLWKLFFAMETNPICAGFELPFALFKYHERGSSYFYVSGDGGRRRKRKRRKENKVKPTNQLTKETAKDKQLETCCEIYIATLKCASKFFEGL